MASLPSTHHFSVSQQRLLATIPHVTGPLSMIGSVLIIRDVFLFKKQTVMYHKLLLGMSCCDLVSSFWFSLSTIPMPTETIEVWKPVGTPQTCTAQGFFIQASLGTAAYNASLAGYYFLMTKHQWTEEDMKKVEKYMLLLPVILGYGTAFAGLFMKLFHSAVLWCWIAPRPKGCEVVSSEACVFDDVPCPFRWTLFYGPLWICIFIAMISMISVYRTVLKQEKEVDAYQSNGEKIRDRSKRVARQSLFYILAFYASWLPTTTYSLVEMAADKGKMPNKEILFGFAVASTLVTPMQGFFNFIVYFRAKYNVHKRKHPNDTFLRSMMQSAFTLKRRRIENPIVPDAGDESDRFSESEGSNIIEGVGTESIANEKAAQSNNFESTAASSAVSSFNKEDIIQANPLNTCFLSKH